MRYAIYFCPHPGARLNEAAARWLGRDAFSEAVYPLSAESGLSSEDLFALTADPRRYGFHATLKAPFRLASDFGESDLLSTFADFCATTGPIEIPRVTLGQIGAFFAIVPDKVYPQLQDFAASVVHGFERFRAPLTEVDIERRKPERLSPAQRDNLGRWGYPYVFDEFRFHLTLTGQVPREKQAAFLELLQSRFAAFVDRPLAIAGLGLFREEEPGGPFIVHTWLPLGAA
ncbi:DUF1045 domain-containing protein [Ciceribacter sp. L1K22]|uniref:DUF1045 domain-containing protein n=1 Tax=Ciceribacter sp. L1K22 TaxID=2820275 RepID=UPI001ABE57D9|nr:DUF1045 domain-containing protein [Ciceribacter sp. L1K22]MBO3758551.1 DUF1045 domain-containing protein [Ciceribacter sp. L1K22]